MPFLPHTHLQPQRVRHPKYLFGAIIKRVLQEAVAHSPQAALHLHYIPMPGSRFYKRTVKVRYRKSGHW